MIDVGNDAKVSISFNWDSCDSFFKFRDGLLSAGSAPGSGNTEITCEIMISGWRTI